jgi:hypothetical protein
LGGAKLRARIAPALCSGSARVMSMERVCHLAADGGDDE